MTLASNLTNNTGISHISRAVMCRSRAFGVVEWFAGCMLRRDDTFPRSCQRSIKEIHSAEWHLQEMPPCFSPFSKHLIRRRCKTKTTEKFQRARVLLV